MANDKIPVAGAGARQGGAIGGQGGVVGGQAAGGGYRNDPIVIPPQP